MTPTTTTQPAPTVPAELHAAILYRLRLAADYQAETDQLLRDHYVLPGGEYREEEFPRGFAECWNGITKLAAAAQDAANDFRCYRPDAG